MKRDLFHELLERYEMARLTSSLGVFEQDKRIKIIDRPYSPGVPSNLPFFVFTIAGMVGGVFLGCGMAVLLELTDTSVRRIAMLEEITGAPVLTRIPELSDDIIPLKEGSKLIAGEAKVIESK